MTSQHTVIRCC